MVENIFVCLFGAQFSRLNDIIHFLGLFSVEFWKVSFGIEIQNKKKIRRNVSLLGAFCDSFETFYVNYKDAIL